MKLKRLMIWGLFGMANMHLVACGHLPEHPPVETPATYLQPATKPNTHTTTPHKSSLQALTGLSDRMPQPGQLIKATTSIHNDGPKTAQASRIRYYLSKNKSMSPTNTFLNTAKVPAHKAGDNIILTRTLRLPQHLDGHKYYILVVHYQNDKITSSTPHQVLNALDIYPQPPTQRRQSGNSSN